MKNLAFVFVLLIGCTENYPSAPELNTSFYAAKAFSGSSRIASIEWSCGADSLWSVFNGSFSFNIDRDEVDVRERTAQGRKKTHRTHDATISYNDETCTLSSGFVSADSVVRIWKGQVWRDRIHRYYLQDEDGSYLINRRYITADGEYTPAFEIVRYRDFLDSWNRDDPHPADLTRIGFSGFYPPVNFSQDALDTLEVIPKDDRPYLEDVIVSTPVEGMAGEDPAPEPSQTRSPSSGGSSGGSGGSSGGSGGSSGGSSGGTGGSTGGNTGGPTGGTRNPPDQSEDPEGTESSDATLSSLSLSVGSISFNPSQTGYSITVSHSTSSITVTAIASHAEANISGDGEHQLSVGSNTVTITVTAEDGSTETYTITVTREEPSIVSPPSTPETATTTPVANLSGYTISAAANYGSSGTAHDPCQENCLVTLTFTRNADSDRKVRVNWNLGGDWGTGSYTFSAGSTSGSTGQFTTRKCTYHTGCPGGPGATNANLRPSYTPTITKAVYLD